MEDVKAIQRPVEEDRTEAAVPRARQFEEGRKADVRPMDMRSTQWRASALPKTASTLVSLGGRMDRCPDRLVHCGAPGGIIHDFETGVRDGRVRTMSRHPVTSRTFARSRRMVASTLTAMPAGLAVQGHPVAQHLDRAGGHGHDAGEYRDQEQGGVE